VADKAAAVGHPNRDKPEAIRTKNWIAVFLIASAVLFLIITWGGWSRLQGAVGVNIFYIAVYVVFAFYVLRWNRGVLPVASALAILMIIFAAVAAPAWFARDKDGFSDPALASALLGYLTLLVIPLQVVLIGFAMRGFQQGWNVEAGSREYFESTRDAQAESA